MSFAASSKIGFQPMGTYEPVQLQKISDLGATPLSKVDPKTTHLEFQFCLNGMLGALTRAQEPESANQVPLSRSSLVPSRLPSISSINTCFYVSMVDI